jgi:PAS domain S-box-containing protein
MRLFQLRSMAWKDLIGGGRMIASPANPDAREAITPSPLAGSDGGDGHRPFLSPPGGQAALRSLHRLNEAGGRLWQAKSLSQGLQEMLLAAIDLLGADMGHVQVFDAGRRTLRMVVQQGFNDEFIEFFHEVAADDDSACGRAQRSGQIAIIEDVDLDASYVRYLEAARAAGVRAVVSMPLRGFGGEPLGVLSAHFRSPRRPTAFDIEQLALYGRLAASFLERWQSDQQVLRENEERLRLALDTARLSTWDWNIGDDVSAWNAQHYELLGYGPEVVPASYDAWVERLHPDDRAAAVGDCQAAARDRRELALRYRILRPDGELRWCEMRGRFFYGVEGRPARMIAVVNDITERRRVEESQRVLVAELQHRTRNLLTVVQSIAVQTREATETRDAFLEGFLERLHSLSRVQNLLSNESGRQVTVAGLLNMEFQAFCSASDLLKIELSGPEVILEYRMAQTLALGIHELATNALKHGALAGRSVQGRLSVTWQLDGAGAGRRLVFEWREAGIVAAPHKSDGKAHGYGRTLIEEDLPYSLSAQTKLELTGDALRCWISIPY